MADQISSSGELRVTFAIKNPSKHDDAFKLSVPVSATVADIQARICKEYEGNPSPSLQTVGAAAA